MNMKALFSGVAIAIDDEVKAPTSNIVAILKQIKREGIPVVLYEELPSKKTIPHLKNLSFIILDWNLKRKVSKQLILPGVTLPSGITNEVIQDNIEFLKQVVKEVYCPIFIFTEEDVADIIAKLESEKLCVKDRPNNIFVKSKSQLKGSSRVFTEITKWLAKNPSVYVLKEWEREYQTSKRKLFADFQELSPLWPKIMWKTFQFDGDNKSLALGELISKNLHTRMTPFTFSDKILSKRGVAVQKKELRRVLEGEKYIINAGLHGDDLATGDFFKVSNNQGGNQTFSYYLNIRPQCDLLRESTVNDTELYCLKGRPVDEATLKNKKTGMFFDKGQFIEKVNHAVVPFLDDGVVFEFLFKDLKIKKWGALKSSRIGRLLPPHINRIQQKYAFYLQRQALPSTPNNAI